MKQGQQRGVFLIEALIAILIFSLGILGMVSMGSAAIAGQSDAQYRTEAANFASEIASKVTLNVDRTPGNFTASLATFAHRPSVARNCVFTGAVSSQAVVSDWVDRVRGAVAGTPGLPGATDASESITVEPSPTGNNKLIITVCWKTPSTSGSPLVWRQHVFVSYIY